MLVIGSSDIIICIDILLIIVRILYLYYKLYRHSNKLIDALFKIIQFKFRYSYFTKIFPILNCKTM